MRQIRTAGIGSGSVELKLPSELRHPIGLHRRIKLHDRLRPNIMLESDLAPAMRAFAMDWEALTGITAADSTDQDNLEFRVNAFCCGVGLQAFAQARPYLSGPDNRALAADRADSTALARRISACAAHYAADARISAEFTEPFAACVAFRAADHFFPQASRSLATSRHRIFHRRPVAPRSCLAPDAQSV